MDPLPPEAFLAGYPEPMREIAAWLRGVVHLALPEAIERVRPGWRLIGYEVPAGRRSAYFAYIAPEPTHVHLGFEHGTLMSDPRGLLLGAGITKQVRWVTLTPDSMLPEAQLAELVREGARVAALSSGERVAIAMTRPAQTPMTAPERSPQPILTDGVVTLRPFRPDDAQAVFQACQDPDIVRFIPIPQPYALEDGAWYVTHAAEESAVGPSVHFACVDAATNRLLGSFSRHGPAPEAGHRASVGYWLAPEARGRGAATRAVRMLIDWTFATTGVVRIELYTRVDNPRSGRVALRAGFELEGVRRAWDVDRVGRPEDAVFYVRLRDA